VIVWVLSREVTSYGLRVMTCTAQPLGVASPLRHIGLLTTHAQTHVYTTDTADTPTTGLVLQRMRVMIV
jgi:hypothetical protein